MRSDPTSNTSNTRPSCKGDDDLIGVVDDVFIGDDITALILVTPDPHGADLKLVVRVPVFNHGCKR